MEERRVRQCGGVKLGVTRALRGAMAHSHGPVGALTGHGDPTRHHWLQLRHNSPSDAGQVDVALQLFNDMDTDGGTELLTQFADRYTMAGQCE